MRFDWFSNKTEVLCNPRLPAQEQIQVQLSKILLESHFWLSTSGTTDQAKWVALSKEAVLASAKAVNEHLHSTKHDIWITALPDFHVGGLGIWARSALSGARVIDFKAVHDKWDPKAFYQLTTSSQCTLTALVPTQIYDLVLLGMHAPKSLRAIIVGGGALQTSLYHRAVALGWNLLPSYGLTECASQVATAQLETKQEDPTLLPPLKILSHIQASTNENGFLSIRSRSLLTGYAIPSNEEFTFVDPKVEGSFQTEDLGSCDGTFLSIQGRLGSFIKIGGESVSVLRLERILEELKLQAEIKSDLVLFACPDERLGHVIHLATTALLEEIQPLLQLYHEQVLPFEKIRKVHFLDSIPRTPLNKLNKNELLKIIG